MNNKSSEKQMVFVFSVTAEDCDWQYFTAGGPGGQHQNRRKTACRCIHRASGARGESRELKSQSQNRERAFMRMVKTPEFERWHRLETARRRHHARSIEEMIERDVDLALAPENIRVEVGDGKGGWIELKCA